MWNELNKQELSQIPKLYETEHLKNSDKYIYLHFFLGSCDWYIGEYDFENEIFFGFTILNGDLLNAEWGYISFQELKMIKIDWIEVDRDMNWDIKKASEIKTKLVARSISKIGDTKDDKPIHARLWRIIPYNK